MTSNIARIIDVMAILIQVPHLFICGIIAGIVREASDGNRRMVIYAWLPATGIFKAHIDSYGYVKSHTISYKELFN